MSEFLNSINSTKPADTSWETEARSFEPEAKPVTEEAPAAEAEAPAETAPETPQEAPESPAEGGDEVQKVVPLKALQEERRAKKELEERLYQIEQMMRQQQQPKEEAQPDDQGPDPETDPIGALKWERQKRIAYEQEMQARQGQERLTSVYASSAREFATKTPDFKDAYEFAITSRGKQLAALGYDVATINETIRAEEMNLAAQALNNGRNPAEVIYEFAKSYGYTGKAPAPATPAVAAAPAVDPAAAATLQKAKAAAATSITGGGKPPKGDFDPASLADLKGAAFDAAWEKMAKQSGSRSSMFRE
jgi:hypothetical protein